MADTQHVLRLAAIIREVDGNHSKGAAALAELILDHSGFRAALADEPAVPAPTVMEIIELSEEVEAAGLGQVDFARAVLARWGKVAPPADGEVAELAAWLQDSVAKCKRAAELLQRQALVPVSVSDALIKAECALSDIAEGEPMTDEGDPLQWAERRCADTLAIIRPTMRQRKIRTSEWPPLPLPEVGE